MELELRGKVALVTGASRGIGRATAAALAREGAQVVVCARGRDALERAAEELRESGSRVLAVTADVGVQEERERLVAAALAEFGRVDCLVSNASHTDAYEGGAVETELWGAHFEVDLLGAVRLTELVAPGMRERQSGSIVFVGSLGGKMSRGVFHGYTAMKAALLAAGKALSLELAPFGVRVNVVAPGPIDDESGYWARRRQVDPEGVAAIECGIPMGRLGRPEEVADCIAFLLSARAQWVVGHCLVIDGGEYPAIA